MSHLLSINCLFEVKVLLLSFIELGLIQGYSNLTLKTRVCVLQCN